MELIASQVLDLAPSCVEFVPGEDGVFVVGTYNLQKENTLQEAENSGRSAVSQVSIFVPHSYSEFYIF